MKANLRRLTFITVILVLLMGICAIAESADTLYLPKDLKTVKAYAFYGSASIDKVVIPEGTKEIHSKAFANSSLKEVVLPDTLTFIADDAFDGCESISVTVPEDSYAYEWAIENGYIQKNVFITTVLEDGTLSITCYIGEDVNVTVPREIDGVKVTRIGDSAFKETAVQSVIIQEGVISIDDWAFERCGNLKEITIPKGVTNIGAGAFLFCSSLTDVTIPEGVTSIGDVAFDGCSSITEIIIPESVTSIGNGVFMFCSGLTEIVIPESVTSMGIGNFRDCTRVTKISILGDISNIGDDTFYGCSSLIDIVIPENVTAIGERTFYNCSKLTEIVLPERVTSIGNDAFFGCNSLTKVALQQGLRSIGASAFEGCTSLGSVYLPDSIEHIGEYAFVGYYNIVATVVSGSYAHEWCKSHDIAVEVIGDENTYTPAEYFTTEILEDGTLSVTGYTGEATEVSIPQEIDSKKVTRIGVSAFESKGITKVIIPEGVTEIDEYAFSWCWNLNNVILPSTLTRIGTCAFNCTSIAQIDLPESLKEIGWSAFSNSALVSLHIPSGVIDIGGGFVGGCFSLQSVTLDSENKNYDIVDEAIYSSDNTALLLVLPTMASSEYTVPDGVVEIKDSAFYNQKTLEKVSLPQSLEIIEQGAFSNCPKLNSITIPSCKGISNSAFSQCTALTEIVIPEGVGYIPYATFFGDMGLKKITLPNSITQIYEFAFNECTSLVSINLSKNIEFIDDTAFEGCPNVVATVEEGSYAHEWCIAHDVSFSIESSQTCVSEIQFGKKNISLQKGDTYKASDYMVIIPYDADNKTVVWSSSNAEIASVDSATGVITALSCGQTMITASAIDGSNVTASIDVEIYPVAPIITNLQLVNGSDIFIQWNDIENVDYYYVYYANEGMEEEACRYEYSETPEYILEGLDEKTTYCIWVTSVANNIMSYDGSPWYITTEEHKISLNVPEVTNVSCSSADDGINVAWNPVTGATGYNVCYSLKTNTETSANIEVSGGSASSAIIRGVTAGSTYYVWVQAVSGASESAFSDTALVVVPEKITCNISIYDDDDSWSPKFEASTAEFYIICDSTYSVAKTAEASWLTMEQAGNTLVLSTTKNTTGSTRSATVSVWCDEHDEEVEIRVKQKTGVDFPKPTVSVDVDGGHCSIRWNAHSEAEGYEYECAMGDTGNITHKHTNSTSGAAPTLYSFLLSDTTTAFFFHVRYVGETNDGPWSDWAYVVVGNNVPVTSVSVNSVKTLYVGSVATLEATVKPSNASCQDVAWSIVSGQSNASIDSATGKLTAVKAGTVKVRATSTDGRNIYGERTLTIYSPEDSTDPVTSISITNGNFSMQLGDSKTLTAKVLPNYATNPAVKWVVRDGSGSASIDSSGILSATATGTVYVHAEAQDGSGVKSSEITVTITEHEHTWGEEYSVNSTWYQSCTSCYMTKAITKYQGGTIITEKPKFLSTPVVSDGMYEGDEFLVTFETTTNVSRIVICYASGSQTVEKEDVREYSQCISSSYILWTIPYRFEYTGDSDTRTVILRCYDKAGNYDQAESSEFTCKKMTVPTVSLRASSSTTISNKEDARVWIDANIAAAKHLTLKVLDPDGAPIYFRTVYHLNNGMSEIKSYTYNVSITDTQFTGIGILFPAGMEEGTYAVQIVAINDIGTSEPAELSIELIDKNHGIRREEIVSKAYEWANYIWELDDTLILHKYDGISKELPKGTVVRGLPYSYGPNWDTTIDEYRDLPFNKKYGSVDAGAYGADCKTLVYDCFNSACPEIVNDVQIWSHKDEWFDVVPWDEMQPGDVLWRKRGEKDYYGKTITKEGHVGIIVKVYPNGNFDVVDQTVWNGGKKMGEIFNEKTTDGKDIYMIGTCIRTWSVSEAQRMNYSGIVRFKHFIN